MAGGTWGDAGLGGGKVFRDVTTGIRAGSLAYCAVALIAGISAVGEVAIVRGNAGALVLVAILTIALTAAAEMVFRGFIMTRVANASESWVLGNIVAALAFGFAVGGRDPGAVAGLTVAGFGYGMLYLAAGKRLALPIAAHVSFALCGVIAAYLPL